MFPKISKYNSFLNNLSCSSRRWTAIFIVPIHTFILVLILLLRHILCQQVYRQLASTYLNTYTGLWPSAHTVRSCNRRGWRMPPFLYYTVKTIKIVTSFCGFSLILCILEIPTIFCVCLSGIYGKLFTDRFVCPVVLRRIMSCIAWDHRYPEGLFWEYRCELSEHQSRVK